MKNNTHFILKTAVVLMLFFPFLASAKTPAKLELSGWIPYWRTATGTADALNHISSFTEINPFGYTLKSDGTLNDALKIGEEPWTTLIAEAKKKKIRVIPTIMSSNTEVMHNLLSKQKSRIALEDRVVKLVKENGFDGIDIDFEGKKAETKNYFSTFLKGLYRRMGKKWVMCTIEARTPLDSRYDAPPAGGYQNIRYANDFTAINKYCDRVRIMAYDQGAIDLKLNKAAPGPYVPVADPKWVEKVINLSAKTISKKKIVIGVPTYGYEFEIAPTKLGFSYDLLWAFNPKYAEDLAAELNITPERNIAGELSFTYTPTSTAKLASADSNPISAVKDELASAISSSQPALSPTPSPAATPRIVWWSDASAIRDKVVLAKKLGVRGVAIFKIDGGEDPAMWDALK